MPREDSSKTIPLLMLWVGFTAGLVLGLTRDLGGASLSLFAAMYSIAFIAIVWTGVMALEKASAWGGLDG